MPVTQILHYVSMYVCLYVCVCLLLYMYVCMYAMFYALCLYRMYTMYVLYIDVLYVYVYVYVCSMLSRILCFSFLTILSYNTHRSVQRTLSPFVPVTQISHVRTHVCIVYFHVFSLS